MHDVAERRRPAAFLHATVVAVLLVGGTLLFGLGKPVQAHRILSRPATQNFV
jgi:hypothetical protein